MTTVLQATKPPGATNLPHEFELHAMSGSSLVISIRTSPSNSNRWATPSVGLIKMMIAPIIFCTVVHGIASMSDLKSVGRVAIKALI